MRFLVRLLALIRRGSWWPKDTSAILAVLPELQAQLLEVARQVEEAVLRVCGNFTGIAERSRTAVSQAAELLGGGQQEEDATATVERSIEISRATIGTLLDCLERAGKVSAVAISRMEQVEDAVAGIESLLLELQKIAFSNKLVALNAKIEAVHVGQLGAVFEVVAEEISQQGERSNKLAEGIGQRVREMRDRVNHAARDLRAVAAEGRDKLVESRNNAEGALNMLRSVHQRARDSLAMMASQNTELAVEISGAVMGLQFQDRTNQRIAHVVEALQKVERSLGGSSPDSLVTPLMDDVRGAYTMDSERTVLTRSSPETQQAEPGGDVELF